MNPTNAAMKKELVATAVAELTETQAPSEAPTSIEGRNEPWNFDLTASELAEHPGKVSGKAQQCIKQASLATMLNEVMRLAHEMKEGARIGREKVGRGTYSQRSFHGARWLSLLGPNGTGKTYMLKRLDAWRRRMGYSGGILSVDGKAGWIEVEKKLRNGSPCWLEGCVDDDLVLVDDIFAGKDTAFTVSKLYEFMNARLGKWTVFTSNLSIKAIAAEDRKLASRMVRIENVGTNRVVELDENIVDYALRGGILDV